jgi:hypothetical protein
MRFLPAGSTPPACVRCGAGGDNWTDRAVLCRSWAAPATPFFTLVSVEAAARRPIER